MKTKFARYEAVRNEFAKFFGQDELSYIIDNKADLKMVENLNQVKATKDDIAATEQLIGNLNDRVKHISNLLQCFTKTMLPIKNAMGNYDDHTK